MGVALLAARSALRSRLVPVAALLIVLVLGGLCWSSMGDASPAGQLRAYLSLGGSFVSFLLALCAIFLPPRLAGDLNAGRLTQVLTGPLPRSQLLIAWWFGTSAVLAGLAGLGYVAIGLGAEASLRLHSSEDAQDVDVARGRILSARTIARAEIPSEADFNEAAEARYATLHREGRLPPDLGEDEVQALLRSTLELESRSLAPGQARVWRVPDLDVSGETLILRFKFEATWPSFKPMTERLVPLQLIVGVGEEQLWVPGPRLYPSGNAFELAVPVEAVAGREALEITIHNSSADGATLVFPREGPSLLYPAGGFVRNLGRAVIVEISRLVFLVAIGVIMAALFDGKLATLAVLWVVALSYGQGFLDDSLQPGLFGAADAAILPTLRGILWVIPDLGRAELGAALAGGEAIRSQWLVGSAQDVFLRTPLLVAAGALAFTRRELGAIR